MTGIHMATSAQGPNMTYDWKVHENNIRKATFEDYAADQAHIYEHVNANRDVFDMFLNTVRRTSKIAEAVRRQQHGRIALKLTDSVLWLLTLWTRIEGAPITARDEFFRTQCTLSEAIWMKYPDRCPACFGGFAEEPEFISRIADLCNRNRPERGGPIPFSSYVEVVEDLSERVGESRYSSCRCLSIAGVETRTEAVPEPQDAGASRNQKMAIEHAKKMFRRALAEHNKGRRPTSVQDFEDMFKRIYGTAVAHFSLEDVSNHLQEEIGEVAGALADCYTYQGKEPTASEAQGRRAELAEEMADTISWSFSCLFKIRETFDAVKEYRFALGVDVPSPVDTPTMSSLIWKQWSSSELDHLRCKTCAKPEFCLCGWELLATPKT